MGKIYDGLKKMYEQAMACNDSGPAELAVNGLVAVVTWGNQYLMDKVGQHSFLTRNGEDMLIECGQMGILISPRDEISTHT